MNIFTSVFLKRYFNTNKLFYKVIIILLIALSAAVDLHAQGPVLINKPFRDQTNNSNRTDTTGPKKRFGRGAIYLGLAEVVPWTFDRYVANKDYARISWGTVGHNLNPGSWQFDNDMFQTNQIGHPYQGNLFFNAYRVNGYSFWESVPAPFIGSYLWETAAERQSPAPNDFINTSFGGVVLGEMTYRLSNKVINNQARGFKRQVSEVVGLLIDPTNGLNRILDGKWGKVSKNSRERDSSKIYAEFDIGFRRLGENTSSGNQGWYGHAKLLYGTPYENYHTAFSNIAINAEFGKDDSTAVNVVSVYGSLAGWEVASTDNTEHIAVLSANYDYIHNQAFFYGGQSVKINFLSEFDLSKKTKINTVIGTGPILLGAAPDKYLVNGRNYDYGSGIGANASVGLNLGGRFFYNINYRGGWLVTINGNSSHYFLHTVSSEVSYMFIQDFSLAAEPGYLLLHGYYRDYADVSKKYTYLRVSLRYSLDL